MTTYVVLTREEKVSASGKDASRYQVIGEYEGNNAQAAVRAAILDMSDEEQGIASAQTFAATPSSNWQLYAPKVAVKTTVSF